MIFPKIMNLFKQSGIHFKSEGSFEKQRNVQERGI